MYIATLGIISKQSTAVHCCYILFSVHFRTDSNSVRKKILQNSIKFSEPNWIRFGNKKQYLSTEKNSEPNPIRFGKSCNILEKITRLSAHLPNLPDLPTLPT